MIGQEESRATSPASLANHSSQKQTQSAETCSNACGSKTYALSFILPAATVAAIYLPDAMKTGNCAMATIPAIMAGTTALALYRFCKFMRHRK